MCVCSGRNRKMASAPRRREKKFHRHISGVSRKEFYKCEKRISGRKEFHRSQVAHARFTRQTRRRRWLLKKNCAGGGPPFSLCPPVMLGTRLGRGWRLFDPKGWSWRAGAGPASDGGRARRSRGPVPCGIDPIQCSSSSAQYCPSWLARLLARMDKRAWIRLSCS